MLRPGLGEVKVCFRMKFASVKFWCVLEFLLSRFHKKQEGLPMRSVAEVKVRLCQRLPRIRFARTCSPGSIGQDRGLRLSDAGALPPAPPQLRRTFCAFTVLLTCLVLSFVQRERDGAQDS